jgi:ribosomal protein S18 acetylase RimI-like enzyme
MTDLGLEIRDCRLLHTRDVGRLYELFEHFISTGASNDFHPHPFSISQARWVLDYRGSDLYYVVTLGTKLVAYAMLRGWDEGYDVPSLGIALHKTQRGTGLARALMYYLECAARARGAQRIRLKVHKTNEIAQRLYRSCGYSFDDEQSEEWVGYKSLQGGVA